MKLLPDNEDHGWFPYLNLIYFGFFYLDPIMTHAGWRKWLATALGTIAFLALYFLYYWLKGFWQRLDLAGLVLLGVGFAPFHGGASCFFIYASALAPFAVKTQAAAFALLGGLAALVTAEFWLLHLDFAYWFWACPFALVIGAGNVFFAAKSRANDKLKIAQDEVEHLAKVAERERIARDLHDVLGHTLSVIILKSELAGKLIDREPQRAKAEIADVEQTSRAALAEVRSTIRGYRSHSLDAEIRQAKATLETAGVSVESESASVQLTAAQESVVALVVREAVTNVVRHARASNCKLSLAPANGLCLLEIRDDGCGGPQVEGNGLRGMRERVEALGGTLEWKTNAGTHLTVRFPLSTVESNSKKANGCH
jgi:two-component system, NarL family, sensor histidine kinase DesK